ncbi:thioredoxin domain-containing protein [Sandarakinorhabdus sp.]|uniref:thioredoxin domain-containing protein n=1 Tax=Sandarakinorhabdus sp. TaxID=1916663 RepID=UPI003340F994
MHVRTLSLFAALLLGSPLLAQPKPAAARPAVTKAVVKPFAWENRIAMTAQGGVLLGNPAAAVKLVEFGSLTCPHCRSFHETGLPAIKARYLASGRVSYEYRPFTLNGIDLMAGLVMQCQAAAGAWAFVDRSYSRQDELLLPFQAISEADRASITSLPQGAQGPRMAELGKLPEFAAAAGVPRARYDACLAAKPGMDKLLAIRADAVQTHKLAGTPSFLINGQMQTDVFDWAALEPLLAAAVKAAPTIRTK